MTENANIIAVSICPHGGGWWIATSDHLPGLFVAHPNKERVRADVPNTIKALFKAQYGIDVHVIQGTHPSRPAIGAHMWVALPGCTPGGLSAMA